VTRDPTPPGSGQRARLGSGQLSLFWLLFLDWLQRSEFFWYLVMETPAFFYAVFLWFLLLSVTGYSIYVGFGPPSKELRDPFEDHED